MSIDSIRGEFAASVLSCEYGALTLSAIYNHQMQKKMPDNERQQFPQMSIRQHLPAVGFIAWGLYSLLALSYLAYESALAGIICGVP